MNEHDSLQSLGLIVNEILLNGDSCTLDKEITTITSQPINLSFLETFKCEKCIFQTISKTFLKSHILNEYDSLQSLELLVNEYYMKRVNKKINLFVLQFLLDTDFHCRTFAIVGRVIGVKMVGNYMTAPLSLPLQPAYHMAEMQIQILFLW